MSLTEKVPSPPVADLRSVHLVSGAFLISVLKDGLRSCVLLRGILQALSESEE